MNRLRLAPLMVQIVTCNLTLASVLFATMAHDGNIWLVAR